MADIIQLLPDAVANQIAAGEVVQRPASVVKELVENAIDSGATQITINLKDSGKTLIQIIDNGCGMSETDARMAFERHATSKIRQANDLFNIRTMGFRGEALASIAAVASVELKTKAHDAEMGTQINISASKIESQNAIYCDSGTQLLIKNLFFNIPARRKFLKKDSTEFKHVIDEIQRVAIIHTSVHFKLIHNDQEIYNLPVSNHKQRLQNIFGKSIDKELVPIMSESPLIKISGFIGKPELAKKRSGQQFFFVNSRFMKHPYFFRTVLNTYEDILSPDAYPSFFIFLEVDPESIDINIHPTKTEIKFENEFALAQIIGATVKQAIGQFNFTSSMNFDSEDLPLGEMNFDKAEVSMPSIHIDPKYNPFNDNSRSKSNYNPQIFENKPKAQTQEWLNLMQSFQTEDAKQTSLIERNSEISEEAKVIQLSHKYIVTPTERGLIIIHQRRAHHRILYEQYLKHFQEQKAAAQQMAFPIEKELSENQILMIQEISSELEALGFLFKIEKQNIIINALPEHMKESQVFDFIDSITEAFEQFNTNIEFERQKYVAKALSYQSTVGYRSLEKEEMQHIARSLFLTTEPGYCPRGKRIFTMIGLPEIEKQLKI
jgi:DNA mismatch repair protein MutL